MEAGGFRKHGDSLYRKGSSPEPVSAANVDKLHSKIGELVVEWDFLADASQQLLGTRGKKW